MALLRAEVDKEEIPNTLFDHPWVVYAKKPFGGPASAIEYLGRYTHKIAISDHRIESLNNGEVSFWYNVKSGPNWPGKSGPNWPGKSGSNWPGKSGEIDQANPVQIDQANPVEIDQGKIGLKGYIFRK